MRQLALLIPLMLTGLAHAQATATVTTTANGTSAVSVQPGVPVRLAVSVSHNQGRVAGIMGATVVDANAGSASNFSTIMPSLPTIFLGAFVGGSRLGGDIAFTPPGFGWVEPASTMNPMPVWQYDLAIDQPGVYSVVWVAPANAPNVRLYPSVFSFSFVEAQTTYTTATITVLPLPASLAPLALTAAIAHRRRR